MAKGLLRQSPRLLLRPRLLLILTCCTADTVLDTDTGDTEATTVDSVTTDTVAMATTARGPLRQSPRLLLRPRLLLILTCCTADTVLDTDTVATAATATTARGPLRLSPRLLPRPRPIPTCCTADTDTDTGSDMEATTAVSATTVATATAGASRLPSSFRATLDHHQLTDVQKYSKLYQK